MQDDTSADSMPDVYTVEEAAKKLRIGRNAAYALTQLWRDTQGREGLPVLVLGRSLRVPAAAVSEMLARPPIPRTTSGFPSRIPRRIRTTGSSKSSPRAVRRLR